MTLTPSNLPWFQRLSEQLQSLSLLSEALTLRLLELEERLTGCELHLGQLDGSSLSAVDGSEAVLDLLEQTEQRLGRLENLLVKDPAPFQPGLPGQPRLQILHAQPVPMPRNPEDGEAQQALGLDPFPEEVEQPFMDELSA
ncbi:MULTISPECIES: hypothetical protein [Synechococcales]|uniref:hypothetical protein n=1 Tax=Synechococcus sp. CS-1324 TaxID=2847980 RepID=UPI00223BC08C|nr:hypothetical protein [Synechococcus sp. CS-1324]